MTLYEQTKKKKKVRKKENSWDNHRCPASQAN
jgi:hypothetical protein